MKRTLVFFVILLCFGTNPSFAQSQLKIAILDLSAGVNQDQQQVDGLSDMMSVALFNSGVFTIVERTQVEKVLQEKRMKTGNFKDSDLKMIGELLKVDAILTGTINFLQRDTKRASDGTSRIKVGEINIDIRLISVETGEVLSAAGGEIKGSTERELMTKVASMLVQNMDRDEVGVSRDSPYVLLGYLFVYPEDLGGFSTSPVSLINTINKNCSYGYNNWRLPTREELDLLTSNKRKLRLYGNGSYAYDQCWGYGREYNVRLVRSKVVVQQAAISEGEPFFEKTHHNFGTIQVLEGSVRTRFVLKNQSSNPVNITSVEKTSSNITITNTSTPIQAGEDGYVEVIFNPNGRQGSDFKYSIYVNLSNGKKEKLEISGRIE